MSEYCYCVPVLQGGEEVMQQWIKKSILNNPEHDRVFETAGISGEQVWIQPTPMGTFAVVSFDVVSADRAFRTIITSNDPWAVDFRRMLTRAHGIDFSQPMPMNERISEWNGKSTVQSHGQYAFIMPVLPGKETDLRKWNEVELHTAAHDRLYLEAGVDREQVWLQHSPQGDIAIILLNTDSAARAFNFLATSSDPWSIKFRAFLLDVYGVDFSKPVAVNKQMVRWMAKEKVRA